VSLVLYHLYQSRYHQLRRNGVLVPEIPTALPCPRIIAALLLLIAHLVVAGRHLVDLEQCVCCGDQPRPIDELHRSIAGAGDLLLPSPAQHGHNLGE
jgi:hypothetical protein